MINIPLIIKKLEKESLERLDKIKKATIENELMSNREFQSIVFRERLKRDAIHKQQQIDALIKLVRKGVKVKPIVPLLTKAIKTMDLNKSGHKTRILNTPWTLLPDVKIFKIELKGYNLIAKAFGINLKIKPSLTFVKHRNRDLNRYIEHQVIRLEKHRNNPSLYWKIAEILMRRSNAWRVLAINHVFRNWHRNYPLSFIINLNRKVSKIINLDNYALDYKRVYIAKPNGKWRPLGVPAPEWRVYLHMLQCFLTHFIGVDHFPNQHAFLPGRGTLTAWKQIFEKKLYRYKWIYSWDFKGFFDSVNLQTISYILKDLNIPDRIIRRIERIHMSELTLPDELKMDESLNLKKGKLNSWHKKMHLEMVKLKLKGSERYHASNNERLMKLAEIASLNKELPSSYSIQELVDPYGKYEESLSYNFHANPDLLVGVPQGAPTSPILSNLIGQLFINKMKNMFTKTLGYADDMISFSNKPIKLTDPFWKLPFYKYFVYRIDNLLKLSDEIPWIRDMKKKMIDNAEVKLLSTGIEVNKDKSHMIKRNGYWKGNLDFLGLRFDGLNLKANTRKGSKLLFNNEIKDFLKLEQTRLEQGISIEDIPSVLKLITEEKPKYTSSVSLSKGSSWRDYFNNKMIGFVQSRLYKGEWNFESLEQDFNYKFVNNSWSEKLGKKHDLNVFNSSSYACHSLANIFRWNQKLRKPRANIFAVKTEFQLIRRVASG